MRNFAHFHELVKLNQGSVGSPLRLPHNEVLEPSTVVAAKPGQIVVETSSPDGGVLVLVIEVNPVDRTYTMTETRRWY